MVGRQLKNELERIVRKWLWPDGDIVAVLGRGIV
jgi:hypothetical protein